MHDVGAVRVQLVSVLVLGRYQNHTQSKRDPEQVAACVLLPTHTQFHPKCDSRSPYRVRFQVRCSDLECTTSELCVFSWCLCLCWDDIRTKRTASLRKAATLLDKPHTRSCSLEKQQKWQKQPKTLVEPVLEASQNSIGSHFERLDASDHPEMEKRCAPELQK